METTKLNPPLIETLLKAFLVNIKAFIFLYFYLVMFIILFDIHYYRFHKEIYGDLVSGKTLQQISEMRSLLLFFSHSSTRAVFIEFPFSSCLFSNIQWAAHFNQNLPKCQFDQLQSHSLDRKDI